MIAEKKLQQHHESIDSAVSYGVGAAGIALSNIDIVAHTAQSVALILGAVVVAVRLVHDLIRLYRFWKNK